MQASPTKVIPVSTTNNSNSNAAAQQQANPQVSGYFANDPDVVQEFLLDKAKVNQYYQGGAFYGICCDSLNFSLACPFACVANLIGYYTCSKANIEDLTESVHIAVTREGIKIVIEKHNSGCRFTCNEIGKETNTILFPVINSCEVQEPAGADYCGLLPRTLREIAINGGSPMGLTQTGRVVCGMGTVFTIRGLIDPEGFRALVMAMKRGQHPMSPYKHGHPPQEGAFFPQEQYYPSGAAIQFALPTFPAGEQMHR
jgi:hypothetical protein